MLHFFRFGSSFRIKFGSGTQSLLLLLLFACSSARPLTPPPIAEPQVFQGDALIVAIDKVSAIANSVDSDRAKADLILYSKHPDFLIRVQALKGLTTDRFRSLAGVKEVFLHTLNDEHWLVRSFAAKALAKFHDPSVKDAARERSLKESNPRVQSCLQAILREP